MKVPFSKLDQWPRTRIVAVVFVLLGAVALVDFKTGYDISFQVFYLVPVFLATWFVGWRLGVVVSILSVAAWLWGDYAAGARYRAPFVIIWNAMFSLSFYLIVVWLLWHLRELLRDLENRVRQRTQALQKEISERELLETQLLEISEREQRRIGHDLHDSLCQHLAATAMAGQVLAEKLDQQDLRQSKEAHHLVEMTEEAIDLTRSIARGLSPVPMNAEGLMSSLEELAQRISEHFRTQCRFECEMPIPMRDPTKAMHLYRIAQEAVNNALKHGKAQSIDISLQMQGERVLLNVRDDGTGLPVPSERGNGMGIRIMAHRAEIVGGELEVVRRSEGGTLVACSITI